MVWLIVSGDSVDHLPISHFARKPAMGGSQAETAQRKGVIGGAAYFMVSGKQRKEAVPDRRG